MSHHLQKKAENVGDVTENVTPPAEKAENAGDVTENVTPPAERGQKCGKCDGKCHTTGGKGPKVREM